MKPEQLLENLHIIGRLKDTTRHCYTPAGNHESVAEHSWRIAAMAYFMKDEFPEADMDKVIRMCLIHDIGEAFTGDIPAFLKTAEDEKTEENRLRQWVDSLPTPYASELTELYREMGEKQTLEARIYKALDNLEAIISHNESDISTWEPLEYDLNMTYGYGNCQFSDYMLQLREAVKEETIDKIENEK